MATTAASAARSRSWGTTSARSPASAHHKGWTPTATPMPGCRAARSRAARALASPVAGISTPATPARAGARQHLVAVGGEAGRRPGGSGCPRNCSCRRACVLQHVLGNRGRGAALGRHVGGVPVGRRRAAVQVAGAQHMVQQRGGEGVAGADRIGHRDADAGLFGGARRAGPRCRRVVGPGAPVGVCVAADAGWPGGPLPIAGAAAAAALCGPRSGGCAAALATSSAVALGEPLPSGAPASRQPRSPRVRQATRSR